MSYPSLDDSIVKITEMYADSLLPTVVIDDGLSVVWQNDAALDRFPSLRYADGFRMLIFLPLDSTNTEKIRQGQSLMLPILTAPGSETAYLSPIRDDGNSHIGYLVTFVPQQSGVLVNQSDLIANFAKSFREPLNIIFSALSLSAKNEDLPQTLHESMQVMNKNCFRLLRLSMNIVEYSKILSVSETSSAVFDLSAFLANLCESVSAISTGSAAFEWSAPSTPVLFSGGRELLSFSILNILSNSFAFAKNVSLSLYKPTAKRAAVMIRDNGSGIPSEDLPHIFEPFFSRDPAGLNRNGLGLGLPIAKHAIAAMGGSISIESSAANGTSVMISLPSDCHAHPELVFGDSAADELANRFSLPYVLLSNAFTPPEL